MKHFNVKLFKNMYIIYLSIGESNCKDCDGFSHVEDEKSNRISIQMNNNTSLHPKVEILRRTFRTQILPTTNFECIFKFCSKFPTAIQAFQFLLKT